MVMHSENSLLVGERHVGDYELQCAALHSCQRMLYFVRIGSDLGSVVFGYSSSQHHKAIFIFRWYEYYTSSCSRCEGNHDTLHHRYDIPHDSQRAYDMVSHRDYTHGYFEFQTIRMILDLVQ